MNTVILVPRRVDGGPRDALWEWTRKWWEARQSHMPIFEGHHEDGLFNRSAALNTASRLAGDWDVAVIIDADVICEPNRVKQAVDLAHYSGKLVIPHDVRKDLDSRGSQLVINWYEGSWERYVRKRYPMMVSGVIVEPRRLWDEIGGFDEQFRGWGYEDTAHAAAAETYGGGILRMPGELWHLFHPTAREGRPGTPVWQLNAARGQRYRAAIGNPELIRAIRAETVEPSTDAGIPRIFHRVVPEQTSEQVEAWWAQLQAMHPGWRFLTHRDPLVPAEWPETAAHWPKVLNGAQLADLVRLEALWRWGGVYLDSDMQPLRSFEPLQPLQAFAAWEDSNTVPNAVLGARQGHPAIRKCLDLAIRTMRKGTWEAGPGVTTAVLPGRDDVLLLPPGSLFPVHYKDARAELPRFKPEPWSFAVHHWHGSWLPAEKRWNDAA